MLTPFLLSRRPEKAPDPQVWGMPLIEWFIAAWCQQFSTASQCTKWVQVHKGVRDKRPQSSGWWVNPKAWYFLDLTT